MTETFATTGDPLLQLEALDAQLKERLAEAKNLRVRLISAREANAWPDLRLATQILVEANRRAH